MTIASPAAHRRALAATIGFGLVGIGGAWWTVTDVGASLPFLLFYVLLVVNTFASIRCFGSIPGSESPAQRATDALLVAVYALLATRFAAPLDFLGLSLILFLVAMAKYALLLRGAPLYGRLLRRKIVLDGLCALACALALGGTLAGYDRHAPLAWAGAFLLGNLYVLGMSDLYRLQADQSS